LTAEKHIPTLILGARLHETSGLSNERREPESILFKFHPDFKYSG